jgi:hypothetical protein
METNKKWYKKWWVWGLVFIVLLIAVVGGNSDETTGPITNEIENASVQEEQTAATIPEHEVVSESDTSFADCVRKEYKVVVSDEYTKEEVEDVLLAVYDRYQTLNDKTFVFAYGESQRGEIDNTLYKGRLFMNPSCDENSKYEIDFDFWDSV